MDWAPNVKPRVSQQCAHGGMNCEIYVGPWKLGPKALVQNPQLKETRILHPKSLMKPQISSYAVAASQLRSFRPRDETTTEQ